MTQEILLHNKAILIINVKELTWTFYYDYEVDIW